MTGNIESEKRIRDLSLGSDFLRRLESLAVAVGRIYASGGVSSRAGTVRGGRVEFLDHRGYVEGDDIRDLDWQLYGRTDELFVRIFGAEREKVIHILLDLSPSMAVSPDKAIFACRVAAAISHVALAAGDTVSLLSACGNLVEPPSCKGLSAIRDVIWHLEQLPVTTPIDWNRSAKFFASRPRSPGALIVISDFWSENIIKSLAPLNKHRQDIALLHILTPEELSPPLGGNVRLEDSETGEEISLTLGERDIETYRSGVEKHIEDLASSANHHGMKHILCRTDVPFERAVLSFLRAGGLLR